MKSFSIFTTWAICRNSIAVWLHNRSLIAASLIPPVVFLLVGFLDAIAVSHCPIALVTLDQSAQGRLMSTIIHRADVFRVTDATPEQARLLINNIRVAGIITIPADFSQRVAAHANAPITVEINNLHDDFANDIRRAVPDAITQFYQVQGSDSPMKVTMLEHDLRSRDVELYQYTVIPMLVLLVLICSLVNTAVSTAREFEKMTIKMLLLAPVSNLAIVCGLLLAGTCIGLGAGLLLLSCALVLGWLPIPSMISVLIAVLVIACLAVLAASAGLVVGTGTKRIQSSHALSTNPALIAFLLAGGVGILAFDPDWLKQIGAFIPLTYANYSLQMALFYNSSDLLGRDIAILILVTLPILGLAYLLVENARTHGE